jgi:hypothetical protein
MFLRLRSFRNTIPTHVQSAQEMHNIIIELNEINVRLFHSELPPLIIPHGVGYETTCSAGLYEYMLHSINCPE